jgi:apolipoprotein N-acyltransferase
MKPVLFKLLCIGSVYYAFSLSWIITAYPLIDFDIVSGKGAFGFALFYIVICLVAGVSFLTFVLLLFFKHWWSKGLSFIAAIFIVEFLKTLFLSLLFYSQTTPLEFHFAFGSVISGVGSTSLAMFGAGILFLLMGVTSFALFYCWINNKKVWSAVLFSIVCVYFVIASYGDTSMSEDRNFLYEKREGRNILIFKREEGEDGFLFESRVMTTLKTFTSFDALIVFLPENTNPSPKLLNFFTTHESHHFLYGKNFFDNDKLYNGIFLFSQGEEKMITSKDFLIPFGEYVPPVFAFIGSIFLDGELEALERDRGYSSLKDKSGVAEVDVDGYRFFVALCSDAWSYTSLMHPFDRSGEGATDMYVLQSNTLFHSNIWFFNNLYAWHKLLANSRNITLFSVPTASPLWKVGQ